MTLQEERLDPEVLESTLPRVVVVVGSDHHPFDRLMAWIVRWLEEHPEQTDSFFVQAGTSATVPPCVATTLLCHDALEELLEQADVVISHGGPGSALDCWKRGIIPLVVPRLRRHGEHVDDHQLDFCRMQHEAGRVVMVDSYEELSVLLEKATADPSCFRSSIRGGDVSATVARFAELVEELVDRPRPGLLGHAVGGRRSRRGRTSTGKTFTSTLKVNDRWRASQRAVGRKEQQ